MTRTPGSTRTAGHELTLRLAYRPPFAWYALLAHVRRRAIGTLESVQTHYVRTVTLGGASGIIRARLPVVGGPLEVQCSFERSVDEAGLRGELRRMFDLDLDPDPVGQAFAKDAHLGPMVRRLPGLRIPGCWSLFEMTVRAIIGQQVSVAAARTVLERLVRACGTPVGVPCAAPEAARLFPEPAQLLGRDLRPFGLNRARAETLARVAELFTANPNFISAADAPAAAEARLLSVRGIGPWTANYIRLRGYADADAFPPADLGALRATGLKDARALSALAERWRPWRGYALLYLWQALAPEVTRSQTAGPGAAR